MSAPEALDLSWVDRVYALVRNELPGGRILAPIMGLVLLAVVFVWAFGFLWRGFVRPIADMVRGVAPATPATGQLIAAAVVGIGLLAVVAFLQWQLRAIRRDLRASLVVQAAIIEGLPKDLGELNRRIADLESHTDITGLRALVAQRTMARLFPKELASYEGLRRAIDLKSERDD